LSTDQLQITPTNEMSAVKRAIVTEMPSIPTKYSTLSERIQMPRSMNW